MPEAVEANLVPGGALRETIGTTSENRDMSHGYTTFLPYEAALCMAR